MEIVSEPDLRFVCTLFDLCLSRFLNNSSSPEEAGEYVRSLQSLLRALGSSDGNMEKVRYIVFFSNNNNNHNHIFLHIGIPPLRYQHIREPQG